MQKIKSLISNIIYKIFRRQIFLWNVHYDNGLVTRVDLSNKLLPNFTKRKLKNNLEIDMLLKLLKPGMTFFDVGASIGLYSLNAGKVVGNTGSVYAFEASSGTYNALRHNVNTNYAKNIYTFNYAVTNKTGTAEFNNAFESGLSSLEIPNRGKMVGTEKVNTISLDEFIVTNNISKIDFLKIDVEGSEWEVIEGANKTLNNPNLIMFVEIDNNNLVNKKHNAAEHINLLESKGFTGYYMDLNSMKFRKLDKNKLVGVNFVFARSSVNSNLENLA